MTKSAFVPIALLSALAVAATGCAHQPPASLSAQLNVMRVASDMGYNTPKVVDGKTYYCQREELTGSLVPKEACISEDQVMAKARAQGDLVKYLASPPNSYSRPGGGG
jgi:hypothetical protein